MIYINCRLIYINTRLIFYPQHDSNHPWNLCETHSHASFGICFGPKLPRCTNGPIRVFPLRNFPFGLGHVIISAASNSNLSQHAVILNMQAACEQPPWFICYNFRTSYLLESKILSYFGAGYIWMRSKRWQEVIKLKLTNQNPPRTASKARTVGLSRPDKKPRRRPMRLC